MLIITYFLNPSPSPSKKMDVFKKSSRVNVIKCLMDIGDMCTNLYGTSLSVYSYLINVGYCVDLTLLHAVEDGNEPSVKYLIDKGAHINSDNGCLLWFASTLGYESIVRYLVSRGADVNANNGHALRWAARKGYESIVRNLVENGADLHADDDYALRWAAHNGHESIVRYLVEMGADVHARDDLAIIKAARQGHVSIVRYLTEKSKGLL